MKKSGSDGKSSGNQRRRSRLLAGERVNTALEPDWASGSLPQASWQGMALLIRPSRPLGPQQRGEKLTLVEFKWNKVQRLGCNGVNMALVHPIALYF